jgi:hypothetical protein
VGSITISGMIFTFSLIVIGVSLWERAKKNFSKIQNPLGFLFNSTNVKTKEEPKEEKTEKKEITGEVNPNYLFLSKMQNLILHVYRETLKWDQGAVMELGFRFISRRDYVKAYADTNPNMDINTFDFLPREFFILAIPTTAKVNGHGIVEDGGIEYILYVENVMYFYEDIIALDDAITDRGLSDHAKYIAFNTELYAPEDFIKHGFEDKIEWMIQNG